MFHILKKQVEEKHYIEWIQIFADGKSYRQFLKPGDKSQAIFQIKADKVSAREYCNVHGLWKS
jgi:superoxide reductase